MFDKGHSTNLSHRRARPDRLRAGPHLAGALRHRAGRRFRRAHFAGAALGAGWRLRAPSLHAAAADLRTDAPPRPGHRSHAKNRSYWTSHLDPATDAIVTWTIHCQFEWNALDCSDRKPDLHPRGRRWRRQWGIGRVDSAVGPEVRHDRRHDSRNFRAAP